MKRLEEEVMEKTKKEWDKQEEEVGIERKRRGWGKGKEREGLIVVIGRKWNCSDVKG